MGSARAEVSCRIGARRRAAAVYTPHLFRQSKAKAANTAPPGTMEPDLALSPQPPRSRSAPALDIRNGNIFGEALVDISPGRLAASARCVLRLVKPESFASISCLHPKIARVRLSAIAIILVVGCL